MSFKKLCNNPPFATLKIGSFALLLTIAAFVLQYGFGAEPCTMCWWQRFVHWAMVAVAFGAAFVGLKSLCTLRLLAVLGVIGLGLASWQSAGQLGVVELPAVCGGSDVILADAGDLLAQLEKKDLGMAPACDEMGMTILGLSLAMWNVLAMLAVLVIAAIGGVCCGKNCPVGGKTEPKVEPKAEPAPAAPAKKAPAKKAAPAKKPAAKKAAPKKTAAKKKQAK